MHSFFGLTKFEVNAICRQSVLINVTCRERRPGVMKQLAFGLVAISLTVSLFGQKMASRFDQKLTVDKQIVHVLNRLTFGARPGDVEQVRRLGVEKWIDLQLHPERITENAALEEKVKPLETLKMATWQMLERS